MIKKAYDIKNLNEQDLQFFNQLIDSEDDIDAQSKDQ